MTGSVNHESHIFLLSFLLSGMSHAFDDAVLDKASGFIHPSEPCYLRLRTLAMSMSTSRYTRAFAYGYNPETDRSACGWAHRVNSDEIAMQKAVQECNEAGLEVDCQVIGLNGEWVADESLLTPLVEVSGSVLSRSEKQQVLDQVESFLLGDCKQQLKGYLQGNGLKAFAYSVDPLGRYACGVGAGTRNNAQSGVKALAACEEARQGMKASKQPDAACQVLLAGNQLQLSVADYGVDFTPPAESLLTDVGLLELQQTAAYMLEGSCNRKFLRYLEKPGHKVFAYAVEGKKAVCASEDKAISRAAAEHYALSACNRVAGKRQLKATCDLLL
ncbi:hypothetical protein [Aliamphritea spongicola]|nr:hypothetical protein [Aliamphritea spongicola]